MSEYRGIKFYSANDMSSGWYLGKAQKIMDNFDVEIEYTDVNKIIELYNIQQFFEHGIFLNEWSEKEREHYIAISKQFTKYIGIFFSKIDDDNIESVLSSIDSAYIQNFWEIFTKLKIYNRVAEKSFRKLISNHIVFLRDILPQKNLVQRYNMIITEFMLSNIECAEILLDQYAIKSNVNDILYNIPQSLTEDDRRKILLRYAKSNNYKYSYLKLIYETQNTKDLPITDKLRLFAKKKCEEEDKNILESGNIMSYGVIVKFLANQIEPVVFNNEGQNLEVSYSSNWIKENLDYPTLMNNFIYLFDFVDRFFRINHVNKTSELGVLERTLGIHGKKEYFCGIVFRRKQMLATLQFEAYCMQLKQYNITLEALIEWFFKKYLPTEFNVKGFIFNIPSEDASYLDKCRSIASEIDCILKQFNLYVENRQVDQELLQISSNHILFKDVKSLLKEKYIYARGKEYELVAYYLFSDQSNLNYIEGIKSYKCFYDLLNQENVSESDFQRYQNEGITWLKKHRYVHIDECGFVKNNVPINILLRDLYCNGVTCNYYIGKFNDMNKNIKDLVKKNMISYESTLLSRSEQEYFNYILNKAEFGNGLDLRNRYIHGTQSADIVEHKQDYYLFLRLLVLLVLKINDDFCLAQNTKII